MAQTDYGIDLGSSTIVIYARNRGVVVMEPSLIAYDKDADRILAYGEEARQLLQRATGGLIAIRPLKNGAVSDYAMIEKLLQHFLAKAMGRRAIRKPVISICVPSGLTPIEKRTVEEAVFQAGAREVTIAPGSVCAAIGAGIDITKPVGNMVVDIGGSSTDIAVISLGAPVLLKSVPLGGDTFTSAIARHVRRHHSLFIGESQAEEVKRQVGAVYQRPGLMDCKVTGRNVLTGLPMTIAITSEEVRVAAQEAAMEIAEAVHGVMEKTPPEMASDIVDRGVVLTGGGSLLSGFEELIEERTGINTMTAENADLCVAEGATFYRERLEALSRMRAR